MFGMLLPHEIGVIQQDICALVNGPDGCDCTVHWASGDGAVDIYGKPATTVELSEVIRTHASPVSNHNVSVRQVQHQRVTDLSTGDMVLLFLPGVVLSGRPGLWFSIPGFGDFVPELKPPNASWSQDILNASGNSFVTEIYCRPKR